MSESKATSTLSEFPESDWLKILQLAKNQPRDAGFYVGVTGLVSEYKRCRFIKNELEKIDALTDKPDQYSDQNAP